MSIVELFKRVDRNKDGKISSDEFAEAIPAFSLLITYDEIDRMFRELDIDNDGQIDAKEFTSCLMVEDEQDDQEIVMKKAFDVYDINGDGMISANEIHVVLERLGEVYSMEQCVAMVRAVDVDGDGFVNFEEFKTMMSTSNKP